MKSEFFDVFETDVGNLQDLISHSSGHFLVYSLKVQSFYSVVLKQALEKIISRVAATRPPDVPSLIPNTSDLARYSAFPLKDEKWGSWSDYTLERFSRMAEAVHGDFVEIGVAYGATFHRLVSVAEMQGKMAYGIDSFQGMAPPGPFDRQDFEAGAHTRGKFSSGGAETFRKLMDDRAIRRESYTLYEGFIPEVFQQVPIQLRFSLCIIDVDHYQPTIDSLEYAWPRLSPGGILLLDDCALSWDRESSKAIKEWLSSCNDYWIIDYYNNQLFLSKPPLASPAPGM
jgi:hypothetical protein